MLEGAPATLEAINYLNEMSPKKALTWSDALAKSASDHCEDMGSKGLFSHTGSDNSYIEERNARYS